LKPGEGPWTSRRDEERGGPKAFSCILKVLWLTALVALAPSPAAAHPVPYSYVDLRISPTGLTATVVVHIFDVAHDLGIAQMEQLLDPAVARARSAAVVAMLSPRFALRVDGRMVAGAWSDAEPLPERQCLRFQVNYESSGAPGLVSLRAEAFPYDPEHRTYVNFYEGDTIVRQEIFDRAHAETEHFAGTRQGARAVVQRFLPSGIHHILIGPDHILFLVGLLLTGGTVRRLLLIITAFTLAHSVTLSLAALRIVMPPAWIVEPAIALSIVYVGIDNLIRGDGPDARAWIAFGFGFVHGFGFANVLAEMELPPRALGWSLVSFNVGVEIGQVLIVGLVAAAFYAVRARSAHVARLVTVGGSVAVSLAGAYWFLERTFFTSAR
jgi:hydrogenase/urease accessory protein HupE